MSEGFRGWQCSTTEDELLAPETPLFISPAVSNDLMPGSGYDLRRHGARCTLMIRPNINPDGPANKNWLVELGETFLRHAYVVYDFENRQVGLARSAFSVAESDIVPFASRGAKIPLGIPVPAVQTPVKYNTSTHTFYDYPVTKLGVFLAAPGIRSSSLGQSGRYEKDLAIGLGVGLSLGFVAILAA
ncbi:hypothetical protein PG991_002889 [Apiospora marii]|uniref:Peptidase A1 domain-containing protein n=1 Tax=Apiospora marii TaxID=335849 RepID=A0ABR1SGN1_9PEZI